MAETIVIGAGPAGLMAAEELARAGHQVVLAEAKPSPGRKLLMAGKSGLNLTKDEPFQSFMGAYGAVADRLEPMLRAFGPAEAMTFSRDLGHEVFTGSTGRVFPVTMKASPLLRAWLARLAGLGVVLRTRWRWAGFDGTALVFETPEGRVLARPDRVVLALGGASWPRLGSDAAWVPWLDAEGVEIAPFLPANMGFRIAWSAHMEKHFGRPLKGARLCAGGRESRGEVVLSERGIEGGGLYALSRWLRDGAELVIDLAPDRSAEEVAARLAGRAGETVANRLRKGVRLGAVELALLQEFGRPLPTGAEELSRLVKALPVPLGPPRPLDEAISSAGGLRWEAVTEGLELKARRGIFVAGEMLDWEAPTGGYLLTACLATGRWAGRAAARSSGK